MVFLHKADASDALSTVEHHEIRDLVRRFLNALGDAVTSDCHVAHWYGKLLQKLWFPNTDISLDACGDQVNPRPFSYNESFFGSMLDNSSDATTAGLDPCNLEANYRLAPEFDLLYQSFYNSDTDPFNSESVAGMDLMI